MYACSLSEAREVFACRENPEPFGLYENAIIINKRFHKKTTITEMNVNHELLRQLVNLSYELKYINSQKHRVCQAHISEVGKMIGAWVKRLNEG